MAWTRDPSDLVWETTLTAAAPTSDPLPILLLKAGTVQVDGVFGGGSAQLQLGNVVTRLIAVEPLRHAELVPITAMLPVRWLAVAVEGATDDTAVTVTVVGAR